MSCDESFLFQSDTEFWDKMQAEWEELARRNWLDESEGQQPITASVSPAEKVRGRGTDTFYFESTQTGNHGGGGHAI